MQNEEVTTYVGKKSENFVGTHYSRWHLVLVN